MSDPIEEIIKVEVLPSSELQLVLESGGNAMYQHIWREARGVQWDNNAGAFKGTEQIKWTYAEWFVHIVSVCAGVGILLRLSKTVKWIGVSDVDRKKICEADAKPIAIRPEPQKGDRRLTLQSMYGPVRREAEKSWRKKDWFNTVRLYEEFSDHWTAIEKARVAYARKKIAGN